jgi:hypothetical protein
VKNRLTRWRRGRSEKAAPKGRATQAGYSVDPHADGNERADSRILVLQPDGSILRPGPPDIHPPEVTGRSLRLAALTR